MDLKKLCMNGIKYSSIPDDKKKHLMNDVFPGKWLEFVDMLKNIEVEINEPMR